MDNNNLSPVPEVVKKVMNFPSAMQEILNGNRITRESWNNTDEYCLLADGWLTIHIKGAFHVWKVNDGDLQATDWMVI